MYWAGHVGKYGQPGPYKDCMSYMSVKCLPSKREQQKRPPRWKHCICTCGICGMCGMYGMSWCSRCQKSYENHRCVKGRGRGSRESQMSRGLGCAYVTAIASIAPLPEYDSGPK